MIEFKYSSDLKLRTVKLADNNALSQFPECQNTIIGVACEKYRTHPTKNLFDEFNVLSKNRSISTNVIDFVWTRITDSTDFVNSFGCFRRFPMYTGRWSDVRHSLIAISVSHLTFYAAENFERVTWLHFPIHLNRQFKTFSSPSEIFFLLNLTRNFTLTRCSIFKHCIIRQYRIIASNSNGA